MPTAPFRVPPSIVRGCFLRKCPVSRQMTTEARQKPEGDISSVFSSLSGGSARPLDARFAGIKRRLATGHEAELQASWRRLLSRLREENELIARQGQRVIPQIDFADLSSPPSSFSDEVRRRGVAVIRNVVDSVHARAYKSEVEDYVRRNPSTKAFPPDAPAVFELYWSVPQMKARASPNLLAVQRHLMSFWRSKDPDAPISTSHPLSYADRVRIRQPGDAGFALGPHIDGGSVERWEDDGYGAGHVYDKIFSGNWEQYDPWESSCRLGAISDLYNGAGSCSMFRMFQGWLSMSETDAREGTLMVNPLLQLSTAYMLLRPFFVPLEELETRDSATALEAHLHEDNWILEPEWSSTLHGAGPGLSQELNSIMHPHLELENTMVHVPRIQPGDYVAWHCDTIHAVDKEHKGNSDSSVLYIPVCPLTEKNAKYLQRQRQTFLSGLPGPDFPGGKGESEHDGRPTLEVVQYHLSTEGLQAMGLEKFETPGQHEGNDNVARLANSILGFS